MKRKLQEALAAMLLTLPGLAAAQKAAPGLWEYSATMKAQGAQVDAAMARMQERMARMPPEQRQQMEQMMAARGMAIGPGGPAGLATGAQPIVVKTCITPEQAARDEVAHQDANCRQLSQERVGRTLKFKFVCTGERESRGEGEYTFESDKAAKGRVTVDSVSKKGEPMHMEMTHTARWLAADCGDIKPRGKR
ncbi:MAG: DUF3617 domain-containing protein [Rubrivivax sp.]|nr:DUF3617 domain-containing protein [Rubrivivax sp.]